MKLVQDQFVPPARPLPLLDYAQYDRSPQFTATEKAALDRLRERSLPGLGNGPWPKQIQLDLQRLLQPLADVFVRMRLPKSTQSFVRRILFREMIAQETSFWAWEEFAWQTLICSDKEAFAQRYHTFGQLRRYFLPIAYLLSDITDLHIFGRFYQVRLAKQVFVPAAVEQAITCVSSTLLQWGYGAGHVTQCIHCVVCEALLMNRSPYLEDLTLTTLARVYDSKAPKTLKECVLALSKVLVSLGILPATFPAPVTPPPTDVTHDVPADWLAWCKRWRTTSAAAPSTYTHKYYLLLAVGRWIQQTCPEADSPEKWTRQTAAAFVAALNETVIGEWSHVGDFKPALVGKPFTPNSKQSFLAALRRFFADCQEWGWLPRHFDPDRVFATPKTLQALLAPRPRVLSDEVWAKLLWAGLQLVPEDVYPRNPPKGRVRMQCRYPFEMIRALALVWLFAGLRADEICRLRVGCIRWQNPGSEAAQENVCFLEVPTNKTSTAFVKPIDGLAGAALQAWEKVRPTQPAALDPKTAEKVDYLFAYRNRRVGGQYLNQSVIPLLCAKAGVPLADARGRITCHRARATIATQLLNAKDPLSLFELQEWLGHRSPSSTQYYAKLTPTKLARAYAEADYFGRNVRTIEVLLDQAAIQNGAAAAGETWKYYDLGHGFCTYNFFDQCPHRMACARCDFYLPKASSQAQLLEARGNLLRMRQEIPLREEERAAVEDGLAALAKLESKLAHVPTPSGQTPREIQQKPPRELPVLGAEYPSGKQRL
jgi:integrase